MFKTKNKIEQIILDLLFPISCIGCGKDDVLLCDECLKKIETLSFQVCPICEKAVTPNGTTCTRCKENSRSAIDQMIVSASYKNKLLAKSIHLLKYRFITEMADPLGELMVRSLQKYKTNIPDFIIPIPLHPRRLRWRGFNQADFLAQIISKNLLPGIIIPVMNNLVTRKKYTPPQMKISSYKERQKNLKNAFEISDQRQTNLKGKKILLVDDICTTGSTILECAKALRTKNPYSISALVLGRQS